MIMLPFWGDMNSGIALVTLGSLVLFADAAKIAQQDLGKVRFIKSTF